MSGGEYEIIGAEEVIIRLLAKMVLSEGDVRKIVEHGRQKKAEWVKAYNLCDGDRNQSEISKEAKVHQGDLSDALKEWENEGIIYQVKISNKEPDKIYPKGIRKLKEVELL